MNHRNIRRLLGTSLLCLMFTSLDAMAILVTLGEQDFNNGDFPGGVAGFQAPQAGEPAPFGTFIGSDFSTNFSASWTFNYAAQSIIGGTLELGIFDHDSTGAGSQVASFMVDGIDLTASLDTLFESYGGQNGEFNIYTVDLTSALTELSDGSATFSLTLQGPTNSTDFNGAGLDFSTLNLTTGSVPEPGILALMILGLAGIGYRHRRAA